MDANYKFFIYCNNIGNISLVNFKIFHARTNCVEMHNHFVKDKIIVGKFDLVYDRNEKHVVDILQRL
jgi:hypothetical protein